MGLQGKNGAVRRASWLLVVTVALGVAVAPGTASPRLRAVPLRAPLPSWYTPALNARVMEAGPRGVALPRRAALPLSSVAFVGIRPGQLLIFPRSGSLCTANFVFTDSSGRFSIGTAGHCAKNGERAVMVFAPLGLAEIGTVAKSHAGGVGNDFALIEIKPTLSQWVSPSLAYWGGPTGVFTGTGPAPIHHVGWGVVVGTGGTPRAGLGLEWRSDEWRFEAGITPGDSGSPAIVTGGLGAGNMTHMVIDAREDVPVYFAGTAMSKIMQMVGGGITLATCAPIPWPLPGCPPI